MNRYIKIANAMTNSKGKSINITPSPTDTSAVQSGLDKLNSYVDKIPPAMGNNGSGKKR